MNFKKLSLLLLAISLSETALQAMETVPFTRLEQDSPPGAWTRTAKNVYPVQLPKCMREELDEVGQFDSAITQEKSWLDKQKPCVNAKKHIINRNAGIFGGLFGLAAGLCAYTKVFANFNPRNRIVGALATAATSTAFVCKISYSFFKSHSFIPYYERCCSRVANMDRLLDEHCTYLPARMKEKDIPADIKERTRRLLETPYIEEEKAPWLGNIRTVQTWYKILNVCRADN